MAANPEDIELGDAEEVDEDGEGDGGEPAADIQLQEKAVPVRPDLSPTSCLKRYGVHMIAAVTYILHGAIVWRRPSKGV